MLTEQKEWVNYYEYCEQSTAGKTFIIAFEEFQLYQNGNEITKQLDAEGSDWGKIPAKVYTLTPEKMNELGNYVETCPRQAWNKKDEQLVEEMKAKIERLLK